MTTSRTARKVKGINQIYSRDKFELLISDETMELRRTKYSGVTMDTIEDAVSHLYAMLGDDLQNQPVVVPMLANGSSQFPDAPTVDAGKGGAR